MIIALLGGALAGSWARDIPCTDGLSLVSGVALQRVPCSNHAAGGRPWQGARQGQTVLGQGAVGGAETARGPACGTAHEVGRAAGGHRGDDQEIPGRPAEDQQTEQERQEAGHHTDDAPSDSSVVRDPDNEKIEP